MNQQSEHLSNAQIENYGERTSGWGPEQDQRNEDQRVEAHLDDCPSCRARVLDFHRTYLVPQVDSPVKTASTPDCPNQDDFSRLAAGLCSDALAAKLTQHAATCGHCGPLLRAYTEDFSDDFTAEEQTVLDSLQSSSASWQEQTARKMLATAEAGAAATRAADSYADTTSSPRASTDGPADAPPAGKPPAKLGRQIFSWKWALVPATAAITAATVVICGVVGLGILAAKRDTPEKVEKLLAQAYTERRNLEMRIPYAKHSEFDQTRSGESESTLNSPPSQREAGKFIDSHLKGNPDDPKWLLLKARFDLLDWHYKPALLTLEKITDPKVLDSPEFLMTRSLAFYEKAEVLKEKQSYSEAIDLLGRVLQKTPTDPIALFNQALVCEKVSASECARGDWERLLSIETDPNWAAEARRHLNQIEEKKISRTRPKPFAGS